MKNIEVPVETIKIEIVERFIEKIKEVEKFIEVEKTDDCDCISEARFI